MVGPVTSKRFNAFAFQPRLSKRRLLFILLQLLFERALKHTLYGNDENVNRQIYEVLQAHFSYLPDLLRTQQIRELTGFSMTAIQRWVLEKRITAILGRKGWNITRDSLVTFLSSSYCLRGNRKPEKFQALLQKCTEQLKI